MVRVLRIGGRGGLFMILDVSCTVLGGVRDSSQESLTDELVPTNGEFCERDCGWVVIIFCD